MSTPAYCVMYRLSEAERTYIAGGADEGVRGDGRGINDLRPLSVETGLLPQAAGSARLRLGGTDILVGVKLQVSPPPANRPDTGTISFAVECAPGGWLEASEREPEEVGNELAALLQRTVPSGLDLRSLCLAPGRMSWSIYVDALVLASAGNVEDALMACVRAALVSTRIPAASVAEDGSLEVSDDLSEAAPIDTSRVPVSITLARLGKTFVTDPSTEEELCSSSRLTVCASTTGKLLGAHSAGQAPLDAGAMDVTLARGVRIAQLLIEQLNAALAEETKRRRQALGFFAQ